MKRWTLRAAAWAVEDFGDAMRAVVTELSDANPDRALRFRAEVNRPVYCDAGRIQQLFSNLLANALTHGSQTGVTEASALVEGDDVVLSVANDGEPIPPESLGKVFSPFWRRTTASQSNGLGLGLYISAQIVQAHGGRLDMSSSAQNGTRVVARIPLRRRIEGIAVTA
jgi:signal transduction histidine kinase